MTNIRRFWQPEQICFLTHVTADRRPILLEHVELLTNAIDSHRKRTPFDLISWVILPDHIHLLIGANEHDVSFLMRRIKLSFSMNYRKSTGLQEGRIWQNRFWDRIMRDQSDLNRHIDYIHYNPVKHSYVRDPFDWKHSSLADYYARGLYSRDWGVKEQLKFDGEYGE